MSENMGQRPQRQRKAVQQDSHNIIDTNENEQNYSEGTNNLSTDDKIANYVRERKNKRIKIFVIFMISVILVIAICVGYYFLSTGINDSRVVELNNTVSMLEAVIESKDNKIEELHKAVEDTTVREIVPETSLQRVEGSEVPEFWLIEGDFIAPNKLVLPNTIEDINNSNIQIGSMFKFRPSENWLIAVKGTTVEFSHPTKIWGKVKALGHKERVIEADMKQIIQDFFIGYPSTTISYRKIFMGETVSGYMGKASITVKNTEAGTEKEMILNVGFAQRGDYTISFIFANDKESVVAQELIDLFLKSITFGDSTLKLE